MIEEVPRQAAIDVPQIVFGALRGSTVYAKIVAVEGGVVAGVEALAREARNIGLQLAVYTTSGSKVTPGNIVAMIVGDPAQVVKGEDSLLGIIGKASGVATAAQVALSKAGRLRVVCGGWKKVPAAIKAELRAALELGGLESRIVPGPFLYLDKNYVRIFGSLVAAMEAATKLPGRTVAIQIRGETAPIAEEAVTAARCGARVLMVDTGRVGDLREASVALRRAGLRDRVELAFAGNLTINDLEWLQGEDVDVVDIGRAILDAPLLDFRYDVFDVQVGEDGISPARQDRADSRQYRS